MSYERALICTIKYICYEYSLTNNKTHLNCVEYVCLELKLSCHSHTNMFRLIGQLFTKISGWRPFSATRSAAGLKSQVQIGLTLFRLGFLGLLDAGGGGHIVITFDR